MKKINILLTEDHHLARKGIRNLLEKCDWVSEVIEAVNGREAITKFHEFEIDLILMDFNLPELNGFEASKVILKRNPRSKIIALTQFDELPIILNFFKIGAKGFLTKMADEKEILDAIRTVMNGDYYYQSRFNDQINEWLKEGLKKNIPTIHFSHREIEVITLMSRGSNSQQIASELGVTTRTVETYRYDLIRKVKVKNAAELISYVYRNGLAGDFQN